MPFLGVLFSYGMRTDFLIYSNQTYQQVLQERDNLTGTLLAHYTYGHDLLAQHNSTYGPAYYHYDAQLSTRFITDPAANMVNTYEYSAFGPFLSRTTPFPNPFTYTGEYFDAESSLLYLRARYYEIDRSRFLSRDKIEFSNNHTIYLNKYTYAQNNPLNSFDFSGNFFTSFFAATADDFFIRGYENIVRMSQWPIIQHRIFLMLVAITANCALTAAVSTFLDLGTKHPCDISKVNIFFVGIDVPSIMMHTSTAQLRGMPRVLHRIIRSGRRDWYKKYINYKTKPEPKSNFSVDEYPYYSVLEGGEENYIKGLVSLMFVPKNENSLHGSRLIQFYLKCNIIPFHPKKGKFVVVTTTTNVTTWKCGRGF